MSDVTDLHLVGTDDRNTTRLQALLSSNMLDIYETIKDKHEQVTAIGVRLLQTVLLIW